MSCLYFPYYRQAKAVEVTKIWVKKKSHWVRCCAPPPPMRLQNVLSVSLESAHSHNTANLQNNFETASVSTSFYLSPH